MIRPDRQTARAFYRVPGEAQSLFLDLWISVLSRGHVFAAFGPTAANPERQTLP